MLKKEKLNQLTSIFLLPLKNNRITQNTTGLAAQTARNQNAAFIHTEMTWKNGMKSVPVMVNLLRLSLFTNKEQRTAKMISLFNELPDSVKTPLLKAELFSQIGESDSALSIWKSLYTTKPSSMLAFKIGRELNIKNETTASREFLENARKAKMLDGAGYVLLASMRAYEYDYEGIEEIFKETRELGFYSNEVALEEAAFLFINGKYDEAIAILSAFRQPNPDQKDQLINHRARINLAFMYAMQKDTGRLNSLVSDIPIHHHSNLQNNVSIRFCRKVKIWNQQLFLKSWKRSGKVFQKSFIELYTARALLKAIKLTNH